MESGKNKGFNGISRRDFLKTSAVLSGAVIAAGAPKIFAAGSDKLKVGLIGCGGRGTGAAIDILTADAGTEIVAMADLFADRLENSLKEVKGKFPDRIKAGKADTYTGFDGYKKICERSDIDIVISAVPPGFRPIHLKAAIENGKHVFMEKPAGVDPTGIRSVIESSALAEQKGLSIVAGTQRRHQKHYVEIMKRIHDGAIGEIKTAYVYWNGSDMIGYWKWYERDGLPDNMTWQCRSWPWFVWTSGDHIVEQHVHNLDVANWALGDHPVSCMGMGGRQVRTQGNIYDHFAAEYEYPSGVRVTSMCRQINNCTERVSETIVGTKGFSYTDSSTGYIEGENAYKYDGPNPNPYVQEHVDMIAGIRSGKVLNEGKRVAESTMNAILGRMSAYSGRAIKWDWAMKASKLNLAPKKYEFGDLPARPLAVPGKTQLI